MKKFSKSLIFLYSTASIICQTKDMSNFWQNKSVCQFQSIMLAIWQLISAEFVETSSTSGTELLGCENMQKRLFISSYCICPHKDKRSSKAKQGKWHP